MPAPKRTRKEAPAVREAPPSALRETFAALIPPQFQQTLRHLGSALAEFAAQMPPLSDGEAASVQTALCALAVDLRELERFLSALGRRASDRKLGPADRRLARAAGRLVVRVGAVAQAIEETVRAAEAD